MAVLELYHAAMSTCAQKVRLTLAEKGLAWQGHHMDLRAGDQHRPDYLRLNPKGVVPTLVDDGAPVIESTLINEYLDEAFPEALLRPADPPARARMRVWTKRLDEGDHFATGVISGSIAFRHQYLRKTRDEIDAHLARVPDPVRRERQRRQIFDGIEAPQFAAAIARFHRLFADMEAALADGPWLAGAAYSLADIAYTPYLARTEELQLIGMLDDRPRVRDLFGRIKARPSYAAAYFEWRDPAYIALMEEKGAECWPRIRRMLAA